MTRERVTNAIRIKRRGVARFAGGDQRRNHAFRRVAGCPPFGADYPLGGRPLPRSWRQSLPWASAARRRGGKVDFPSSTGRFKIPVPPLQQVQRQGRAQPWVHVDSERV